MNTSIQKFLLSSFLGFFSIKAVSQKIFESFDSFANYAVGKSISLQGEVIKLEQAKKARIAALLSIPDLTGNISGVYTHNNILPVSLFPSEIFGGQSGTYTEVQTGIPYNTNIYESMDIKLLNMKGWENLKLAKLNIESNLSDKKIAVKSLLESIVGVYFNIINLQEQYASNRKNEESASILVSITKEKFKAGLINQQDVNDAEVNFLTTVENTKQIEYLARQQYLSLKLLCDIPEREDIFIRHKDIEGEDSLISIIDQNEILVSNYVLKEKTAFSNYKVQKRGLFPTISLFQYYGTQQFNTQRKVFDRKVDWVPNSYIGLRLQIPIPGANNISQVSKARYDYYLARNETRQQRIKSILETVQIRVDYEKALSQMNSNLKVHFLRKNSYEKNLSLFQEGLIGLEQTLRSFNDMVTSHYNLISSKATLKLSLQIIQIHNSFQ